LVLDESKHSSTESLVEKLTAFQFGKSGHTDHKVKANMSSSNHAEGNDNGEEGIKGERVSCVSHSEQSSYGTTTHAISVVTFYTML